jgi:hypothetical protein
MSGGLNFANAFLASSRLPELNALPRSSKFCFIWAIGLLPLIWDELPADIAEMDMFLLLSMYCSHEKQAGKALGAVIFDNYQA